jgi:glycosyltransferase involved in cell wall biosynthesis
MRIGLLHYAAPPVVGGVESVLGHHARLMADAGHQVRIIAGRGAATDPRVEFVSLPLIDSRHPEVMAAKTALDTGSVPAGFPALVEAIHSALDTALAGVDVLIAHNVCSLHKNLALTAALRVMSGHPGAPRLILWHHDLSWTTSRYRAELHDGYPWELLRTDWPGAGQVVVSELRRRELADLLAIPLERITVIPNGVDLAAFYKLEEQTQALARQMCLLDAAPILLLPVRITPRKNIELALHTLAALRQEFPSASLVVTGPLGPHNPANVEYFDRLRALRADLSLEGSAHFLAERVEAYLPDPVIADFYRLADALLLPSREEGFGIPVIEAALAGLPVFCADIPPLRDLGSSQVTYFSPDADPEQIAGPVARRLSLDPVYQMRVRVRSTYSWERVYAQHIVPLLKGAI